MKKILNSLVLLFICSTFASCSKEPSNKSVNIPISVSNLSGKWTLVNDTTTTSFWGLWNGQAAVGINYIGKAGDYYNFTSHGKLYTYQNTNLDTQTYKLGHDTVWVRYTYIDGQTDKVDSAYNPGYIITRLTDNSCTLTSFSVTPETIYNSVINLSR